MSDFAENNSNKSAIEEYEQVSSAELEQLLQDHKRPFVLRGLASHWPLVKAAKDSMAEASKYIKGFETGAEAPLVVLPGESNGRMFYNDNLNGFNFKKRKSKISEALQLILDRQNEKNAPHYLYQCLNTHQYLTGLEEELGFSNLPQLTHPRIWIGSKARVAAHFDDANNIAVTACGRRRFTLFPPEQVSNLYVGRLDFTPAGQPISLVDIQNPDLEKFPRFSDALASSLSVELKPGDAIYIPTPWWHAVEALDELNILVNYWWDGAKLPTMDRFATLIHAIQAFRHLPEAERNGWKSILDYYAFESHGDPSKHLLESDPGILGPMTPKLAQHIDAWLLSQLRR